MGLLDGITNAGKGLITNKLGIVSDCVITMYELAMNPADLPPIPAAHSPLQTDMAFDGQRLIGEGVAVPAGSITTLEYKYTLPFNPKEMTITAGVNLRHIPNAANPQQGQPGADSVQANIPEIFLTVPLVFDEMNIADAFTMDKFNTGVGQLAKNIGTGIAKIAKGAEWTVQPVVEGFLGALRYNNTQKIRFVWGEFDFVGLLNQCSAEYTMFSPAGNPIRAKVSLRIKYDPGFDAKWKSEALAFIGKMTTDGGIVSDLSTAKDKLSNVLNIGW
jgi:hypothetical protein